MIPAEDEIFVRQASLARELDKMKLSPMVEHNALIRGRKVSIDDNTPAWKTALAPRTSRNPILRRERIQKRLLAKQSPAARPHRTPGVRSGPGAGVALGGVVVLGGGTEKVIAGEQVSRPSHRRAPLQGKMSNEEASGDMTAMRIQLAKKVRGSRGQTQSARSKAPDEGTLQDLAEGLLDAYEQGILDLGFLMPSPRSLRDTFLPTAPAIKARSAPPVDPEVPVEAPAQARRGITRKVSFHPSVVQQDQTSSGTNTQTRDQNPVAVAPLPGVLAEGNTRVAPNEVPEFSVAKYPEFKQREAVVRQSTNVQSGEHGIVQDQRQHDQSTPSARSNAIRNTPPAANEVIGGKMSKRRPPPPPLRDPVIMLVEFNATGSEPIASDQLPQRGLNEQDVVSSADVPSRQLPGSFREPVGLELQRRNAQRQVSFAASSTNVDSVQKNHSVPDSHSQPTTSMPGQLVSIPKSPLIAASSSNRERGHKLEGIATKDEFETMARVDLGEVLEQENLQGSLEGLKIGPMHDTPQIERDSPSGSWHEGASRFGDVSDTGMEYSDNDSWSVDEEDVDTLGYPLNSIQVAGSTGMRASPSKKPSEENSKQVNNREEVHTAESEAESSGSSVNTWRLEELAPPVPPVPLPAIQRLPHKSRHRDQDLQDDWDWVKEYRVPEMHFTPPPPHLAKLLEVAEGEIQGRQTHHSTSFEARQHQHESSSDMGRIQARLLLAQAPAKCKFTSNMNTFDFSPPPDGLGDIGLG